MIEYWHWHTIHFGTETYWIGILPHDQQPGRVYARARPARRATSSGPGRAVVGLRPDAQVGLLYSARSKWGLAFQASLPRRPRPASSDAREHGPAVVPPIFEAFYRGTFEAGVAGPDRSTTSRSSTPTATALIDPPSWPRSCRC